MLWSRKAGGQTWNMLQIYHRCQGQKYANFLRCANLQSIEIKCVIYVKVNQVGKRNLIVVKKYQILLRTVNKCVALFTYLLQEQTQLCIFFFFNNSLALDSAVTSILASCQAAIESLSTCLYGLCLSVAQKLVSARYISFILYFVFYVTFLASIVPCVKLLLKLGKTWKYGHLSLPPRSI